MGRVILPVLRHFHGQTVGKFVRETASVAVGGGISGSWLMAIIWKGQRGRDIVSADGSSGSAKVVQKRMKRIRFVVGSCDGVNL